MANACRMLVRDVGACYVRVVNPFPVQQLMLSTRDVDKLRDELLGTGELDSHDSQPKPQQSERNNPRDG